jgi:hypothetical protein
VQKVTKGTFFRTIESSFRFYVTHSKLDEGILKDGVVDEARAKLTKRELAKQQIVRFEFGQVRRVYANMMAQGKVTLVISESEEPRPDLEKTFKVMINGAEPAELKRFCQAIEEEMKIRKEKKEEREQKVEEEY